jgi:hypothetical protein
MVSLCLSHDSQHPSCKAPSLGAQWWDMETDESPVSVLSSYATTAMVKAGLRGGTCT